MIRPLFVLLLVFACARHGNAQQKYGAADIHSHNDYTRPEPFYHAFNAGVGAIEADGFLRDGILMVAHDSSEIRKTVTLKQWYLDPLQKELGNRARPVRLLIDFKEPYKGLLQEL